MFGRLGALGSLGALGGGGRRTAVDDLSVTVSARASVSATGKAAYLASVSVGAVSAVTVETGVEVNVSAVAAVEALARAGYRASVGVSNIAGVTAAGVAGRTASVAVSNIAGVSIERDTLDADAQAVINAMTSTPTAGRQTLIENLVAGLKADGLWAETDYLAVLAAHDAQAASINWKSPSGTKITAVNSPTFTADQGYTGNGTSAYLRTGHVPSTDAVAASLNDAGYAYWVRTNNATTNLLWDNFSAWGSSTSRRSSLQGNTFAGQTDRTVRINGSAGDTVSDASITTRTGLITATRTGSAQTDLYYDNGSSVLSGTDSGGGFPDVEMYALARNNNGSAASYSPDQLSILWIGSGLSAAQVSNLYSRLNTYMAGL